MPTPAQERDPLQSAREAFLEMLANAETFDEDYRGDWDGGPTVFHLTVDYESLRELVVELGVIQPNACGDLGWSLRHKARVA